MQVKVGVYDVGGGETVDSQVATEAWEEGGRGREGRGREGERARGVQRGCKGKEPGGVETGECEREEKRKSYTRNEGGHEGRHAKEGRRQTSKQAVK